MNTPVARASVPWGGLVAELREVILTTRPRADAELIERACEVAARCHQGQLRRSGDPYITHPVAVATILARLDDAVEVDDQTLCAAILHDTVQDTPYTLAALRREFGTGIAALVAGHMALDRLDRRPGRQVTQVMAAITSADARVVATKLADRLHNMQTLQFLPQAKQLRKPSIPSLPAGRRAAQHAHAQVAAGDVRRRGADPQPATAPVPPPGHRRAGHRGFHQPARPGEGRAPDHAL